jgi:hypothetical protein
MTLKSKTTAVLGLSGLAFLLIVSGSIACKKAAQEGAPAAGTAAAPAAQEGTTINEGLNEVSGTVKSALGKYFYISQLPGFDIVAAGQVDTGDASVLLGKDVKVKAVFNHEKPSVLVAQSVDIKEGETQFKNVFNKTDAAVPEDYFDQKTRPDYQEIKITNINKSEDWEGKGTGKVRGKLIPGAGGQGNAISILDEKDKEAGKIIVDNVTEYATYCMKKLRLFDTFWFYFNIKDSVDKKLRPKNKEIFRADIVFTGLY